MSISTSTDASEQLARAGAILASHGLVTAFGHVSVRDGRHMLITPTGPLRSVSPASCVRVPLDVDSLPQGAPLEAWLHLAVYRAREDAGAVCRAQPDEATALAAAGVPLTPITGHAVVAGAPVPVSPDAALARSPEIAARAVEALGGGTALILRGNGAITVADRMGRAVARMWLLDRVSRSVALAAATGSPRDLSAEDIAGWSAVSDELLDRIWAYLCTPDPAPIDLETKP